MIADSWPFSSFGRKSIHGGEIAAAAPTIVTAAADTDTQICKDHSSFNKHVVLNNFLIKMHLLEFRFHAY